MKCEKDSFKDLVQDGLKEKKSQITFENLEQNFYLLLQLEEMPIDRRSVKTHTLLKILNAERHTKKRIEEFNRKESD